MNYAHALTFLTYALGVFTVVSWPVLGLYVVIEGNNKWLLLPTSTTIATMIIGFFAAGLS